MPTPGPLAEWGDRVVATLIDALFLLVVGAIVSLAAGVISVISDTLGALIWALSSTAASFYWLYLGYLEGIRGQSPAKAIRGLKVVRASDGQLLGGGMGVVRKIAHFVDSIICFIGYLFPLWDPMKQTIADKLVETVVIKDQEMKPFSQELFLP